MGEKGEKGAGIPGNIGPRGFKGFKGERGIGIKGQKGNAANTDPRQLANWKQCAWKSETDTDSGKLKVCNPFTRSSQILEFLGCDLTIRKLQCLS